MCTHTRTQVVATQYFQWAAMMAVIIASPACPPCPPCVRTHTHKQVVATQYFQWAMMAVIIASSVSLAFNTVDLRPGDARYEALYVLDVIFTTAFCLEVGGCKGACRRAGDGKGGAYIGGGGGLPNA